MEKRIPPVVKFTSVRVMLAIVAVQDLELDKMDVIAFLNGGSR